MLKKLFSILLTATMILSMMGCGGTEDAAADSDFKVGMVTSVGGVNDGSYSQSAWEGLTKAQNELGVKVTYLESKTDADYASNIETFIDEEYDVIMGVGFQLADAIAEAATTYPDQKFVIIDDSTYADLPNLACLMFEQAQASYLVGYIAGMTTQTDNIGFVLGMISPVMHEFGYGYTAGVLAANPDAKIQMADANSFVDSAIGKSIATSMITSGADVIFHAAAGTGLGVIEACKESNIYAIGVDFDQNYLAPEHVITSALKKVNEVAYIVCEQVVNDSFKTGITVYDLSNEGVGYADCDLISEDVRTAVEEVKAKILSGEIVVPKTKADFEALHGDIYTLD
ncbi:MAG: BMP family ABC transporter substrate-binding protein [Lachnospiraceae bacterium]|nr:BMP family ABC transporter substrate-binding protein [Lachnospiraceae bacterium]MBR4060208.1 BMP family ABC transporter substrate-binding protein [Lachnospiraceae bacterium]